MSFLHRIAKPTDPRDRFVKLTEPDFVNLIRFEMLTLRDENGRGYVKLCLEDIGYERMIQLIEQALKDFRR